MKNTQRDTDIGSHYESGVTVEQLATTYELSPERVRQILKKQSKFVKNRHIEYSDREKFLGVNISATVKAALKEEADRRGISMSSLTADVLRDMLVNLGYLVEAGQVSQ